MSKEKLRSYLETIHSKPAYVLREGELYFRYILDAAVAKYKDVFNQETIMVQTPLELNELQRLIYAASRASLYVVALNPRDPDGILISCNDEDMNCTWFKPQKLYVSNYGAIAGNHVHTVLTEEKHLGSDNFVIDVFTDHDISTEDGLYYFEPPRMWRCVSHDTVLGLRFVLPDLLFGLNADVASDLAQEMLEINISKFLYQSLISIMSNKLPETVKMIQVDLATQVDAGTAKLITPYYFFSQQQMCQSIELLDHSFFCTSTGREYGYLNIKSIIVTYESGKKDVYNFDTASLRFTDKAYHMVYAIMQE